MKRLTKPEYAVLLALAASYRSEDPVTRAGAAIFDENFNTLGTGFNGLAPGMEVPEWMKLEENRTKKALLFTHAEANCLIKSNWLKKPFYMATNINPCSGCAKLIAAAGIKQIYYISDYERGGKEWMEILDFYSVKYEKVNLPIIISYL
jgi:deoxycytidylate deaminase